MRRKRTQRKTENGKERERNGVKNNSFDAILHQGLKKNDWNRETKQCKLWRTGRHFKLEKSMLIYT